MSSNERPTSSARSPRSPERDDSLDIDTEPAQKRRKRARLNCAECRRLKLKCDRTVPCAHCVKRKCQDLCPNGTREAVKKTNNEEVKLLQDQIKTLQKTLAENSILPPDMAATESATVTGKLPAISATRTETEAAETDSRVSDSSDSDTDDNESSDPEANDASGTVITNDYQTVHPIRPSQPPPAEPSHGTLVLSRDGRSKYLGPSAASEWLKDQEIQEVREQSPVSRAVSPRLQLESQSASYQSFPFSPTSRPPSTATILDSLPNQEESYALTTCYHRYFGWSYNIAPRSVVDKVLEDAYRQRGTPRPVVDLQSLALAFMVLAMGTLHNLELSPNDPMADDYVAMAKTCLVKDSFMTKNTIAGVQTLNVMAHYNLETDRGRNGDSAWPLWGLAMRIIQAMGLHRDGAKWNLEPEILEQRRRIFWETHSAEVFQANCFSRPCSISPEFVDTVYPVEGVTYSILKFQLCRLAESVLRNALLVQSPPVGSVVQLYDQITAFERSIPFPFRCRTALVSLPSLYADSSLAIVDSPEINRRDLRRTFEQHSLALMTSEAVVNLYRPLFMQALAERPDDPTRSSNAQAFLAVIERNNAIIQIACSLYSLYPTVTARHWWVWYHAFNSAVCMGTLLLMSPLNDFAHIALSLMDQVSSIYTTLVQTRAAPRTVQNLQWILRLRERATIRMSKARAGDNGYTISRDEDTAVDAGLLGWKTRFIERAAVGSGSGIAQTQTARTISSTSPAQSNRTPINEVDSLIQSMPQILQQHVAMGGFGGVAGPMGGVGMGGVGISGGGVGFGALGGGGAGGLGASSGVGGIGGGVGEGLGGMGAAAFDGMTTSGGATMGDITGHGQMVPIVPNNGSTDQLLHQFWDPVNLPNPNDGADGQNWWSMLFNIPS